jgi:Ni,Fe-hydrogenase III component G
MSGVQPESCCVHGEASVVTATSRMKSVPARQAGASQRERVWRVIVGLRPVNTKNK